MAMIMLYKKLSPQEVEKAIQEATAQVTSWFEQNPKRRVCNLNLNLYGPRIVKVRRNSIEQNIRAGAER